MLRGGITGVMKLAGMCEAVGLRCELHMSGFGNLQVLGATSEDVCEYYERGLLGRGFAMTAPRLSRGTVRPAQPGRDSLIYPAPGLGYQIRWDYIESHRLPDTPVEPVAPLHPR